MRKLIISHYIKENYTVSYPVLLSFKMFYLMESYLRTLGYEINKITDFLDTYDKPKIDNIIHNYSLTDTEIDIIQSKAVRNLLTEIKNTTNFDNAILIGFHPKGFDSFLGNAQNTKLLKSKNIKLVMWQDDLHAFNRCHKIPLDKPVIDIRLASADLILTPSRLFFENQKSPYLSKTIQYFYCLNETLSLDNPPFRTRRNKILLSGACYLRDGVGYPVRNSIYKYWFTHRDSFVDYLDHPSYDRLKNGNKSGHNYYKILASYKGAFFGFAQYPQNYVLAKIIEILSCGTLGFFEYSPQLEKDLGLIQFRHYVPILVNQDNKPIFKKDYYMKYLTEGAPIAEEGRKYIRKFTMKSKCNELHSIIKAKL